MIAKKKIKKVLIANRGVSATRIMHTCRDRKIATTAVYSTPDRLAHHVFVADSAIHIGEAPPAESYLNIDRLIDAALQSESDAIHPGWGFLSENARFAERVVEAGLTWIGPDPAVIRTMGDKIRAKEIARQADVPIIPGINAVTDPTRIERWVKEEKIQYPIMIKPSGGGGGKGMLRIDRDEDIIPAFHQARSEAFKSFGDDTLLVEKYIEYGRHIEVQVISDQYGDHIHLYERECTIQRRHQKIIEEAPSPSLDDELRNTICETAVRLMRAINYNSAGTVEFLFDPATGKFYFIEVNTRLQVEHGITELITGQDIVGLMIDSASGWRLPFRQEDVVPNRWALEVRLNAEDPKTFLPSFGTITRLQVPQGPGVRIAAGVYEGMSISPYYDSLFMLLMTAGSDREDAIRVMDRSLARNLRVEGIKTLTPLLLAIIRHPQFIVGEFSTRFLDDHLGDLISKFREKDAEDEVLKVARLVAEISALGPRDWM